MQMADSTASGSPRAGWSWSDYDAAGNQTYLYLQRLGPCIPSSECDEETYYYDWDEVGRLVRARRWGANGVLGAELQYAYDASDARVRKTVVDPTTLQQRHSLYIFNSLELRLAAFDGDNYELSAATEVPYLFGHGVRLARVVHTAPDLLQPSVRVFLELGDQLGSSSVVLDLARGELVERNTAYAYGGPESSYRPERWHEFREDYRFTGKEDDIEVGLIYFGARYLNPQLGRWISPDPLAVHAPGKADLNLYAYVHGRVLVAVDPVGLQSNPNAGNAGAEGGGSGPPKGEGTQPTDNPPPDPKPGAEPTPPPAGPDGGTEGTGNSDPHAETAQKRAEQEKQQTVAVAMQKLPPSLRKPDQLTPLWKRNRVRGWLYRTSAWKSEGDYYLYDPSGQRLGYAGEKPLIRDYTIDMAGPPLVMGGAVAGRFISRMIPTRLQLTMPSFSRAAIAETESVSAVGEASPAVQNALRMIQESGATVRVNPKSPSQEGNVTLNMPDGTRLNLRVETHPIPGSQGVPTRHGNVQVVRQSPTGKNITVRNDHIVEPGE